MINFYIVTAIKRLLWQVVNGYFGICMELIEMDRLNDHQTIASKYAIVPPKTKSDLY